MIDNSTPLVSRSGDRLITTSLAISQHFGKKHHNILQAIERLDCSKEFAQLNFQSCSYFDGNQRPRPMYEVTRDGFTFLCMGFTGKTASRWKERYINAFNDLAKAVSDKQVSICNLQDALLKKTPLWQSIKHYTNMGLGTAEIARLVRRSTTTVRQNRREMEQLGLLPPPLDLPKMQQLALNFHGGEA